MSKKHDRQRVFGHGRLSKLQKIKENATPIEESSFYVISLVRKSFPFDVCMFENPLPVMDFEHTYIERKRFAPSRKSRAKRVCFKTPLPVRVFDDSA